MGNRHKHWDCKCAIDRVQPMMIDTCRICGAIQVDRPLSDPIDVQYHYALKGITYLQEFIGDNVGSSSLWETLRLISDHRYDLLKNKKRYV